MITCVHCGQRISKPKDTWRVTVRTVRGGVMYQQTCFRSSDHMHAPDPLVELVLELDDGEI